VRWYFLSATYNGLMGRSEPAHTQMAENKTAYILLSLLKDGAMKDNEALLSFSYDLVELASEQGMAT